jgi:hypothetical protein
MVEVGRAVPLIVLYSCTSAAGVEAGLAATLATPILLSRRFLKILNFPKRTFPL